MDILAGRNRRRLFFSQPGPPQSHGQNQVSVPSMALVLRTSSMRELEGQVILREKTKKSIMFFMTYVRHCGSGTSRESC